MDDALVLNGGLLIFAVFGCVLILVVMDDALVHQACMRILHEVCHVLILVLMEDALAHIAFVANHLLANRLNPCFNGRCTRTNITRRIRF